MKLIKLAFISLFFLFLVVTAISLLIPSDIRISKAINIYSEKDSIFALVGDTAKWKLWHPAFMTTDSAPAFPVVHIVQKNQNDSAIVMRLQQAGRPEVLNGWQIYRYQAIDSLTLQWYMDFHLKWYPWKKFGSLFYENTYGVMMEQGLENIKQALENRNQEPAAKSRIEKNSLLPAVFELSCTPIPGFRIPTCSFRENTL